MDTHLSPPLPLYIIPRTQFLLIIESFLDPPLNKTWIYNHFAHQLIITKWKRWIVLPSPIRLFKIILTPNLWICYITCILIVREKVALSKDTLLYSWSFCYPFWSFHVMDFNEVQIIPKCYLMKILISSISWSIVVFQSKVTLFSYFVKTDKIMYYVGCPKSHVAYDFIILEKIVMFRNNRVKADKSKDTYWTPCSSIFKIKLVFVIWVEQLYQNSMFKKPVH